MASLRLFASVLALPQGRYDGLEYSLQCALLYPRSGQDYCPSAPADVVIDFDVRLTLPSM
jgi:hypothetical protein